MGIFFLAIVTGLAAGWLVPHALAIGLTSAMMLTTAACLTPFSGAAAAACVVGALVLHQLGFLLGAASAPSRGAACQSSQDSLEQDVATAARALSKTAAIMRRTDRREEPRRRRSRG